MKMPESTFRKKVNDRCFSVEEAFLIKDNLFPEADMRYLFDIAPAQVNGNECEGRKEVKR